MVILFGLIFVSGVQPLMMVFSLIFITILYSMEIYKVMGSYWFSYVLLLVVLSGVLVVFTYVASFTPNESFEMKGLILFLSLVIVFLGFSEFSYGEDLGMLSFYLWISYIGLLNMFLVGLLLVMMVIVVWLSCVEGGSVRVIYWDAWGKSVNLMD